MTGGVKRSRDVDYGTVWQRADWLSDSHYPQPTAARFHPLTQHQYLYSSSPRSRVLPCRHQTMALLNIENSL